MKRLTKKEKNIFDYLDKQITTLKVMRKEYHNQDMQNAINKDLDALYDIQHIINRYIYK